MKLLFRMFDLPIIGKWVCMKFAKMQGGMQESKLLREYVKKKHNVEVGMYSYGGCFQEGFNNGGKIIIGKYCSFATDIHYFGANHPLQYVSSSPYFYNKSFSKNVHDVHRETLKIGNDVWIGHGVIITSSCKKIGNGSAVAAGSVVTKDVPPYSIVAGVPAKVIKYRFTEEIINNIEKSKWWNYEPSICLKYYNYIDKPLEFCRRISNDSVK